MGHTSQNIQHSLTRILTELEITWRKTITALSLYGQQKILDNFATCLGTEQLTLDFLLLTDTSNYEFCIRGLFQQYQPEVKTRVKRDIGVGSMLFGNGREILNLENDLQGAIESFNNNFKTLETFDNGVVDNIKHLQESIATIGGTEQFLQDKLIELQMEMYKKHQHINFLMIKSQQIAAHM